MTAAAAQARRELRTIDRRERVLLATLNVVARVGLQDTTIREIAKEAHCSTGSLAHYFKDKDDLLRQALEFADARIALRIEKIIRSSPPKLALRKVLEQVLPLDTERSAELTLDVNFWGKALVQSSLRGLEHADHDKWRGRVHQLVASVVKRESLSMNALEVTDLLVAFVDGLGLQALIYPEILPPRRQVKLLNLQLTHLGLLDR